jgi:hypothetical protein
MTRRKQKSMLGSFYQMRLNFRKISEEGLSTTPMKCSGRILLRKGDVAAAKECLLASGQTSGDPSLNSFGPNLLLARELLQVGQRDTVLRFLDECSQCFWNYRAAQIKTWQDAIQRGTILDFGQNLRI